MTIPWQDFFRPDPQSSNRSLKKYLQDEGLQLGHRDLVLVRKLAELKVFLSYAVLETWSEGELESSQLDELGQKADSPEDLSSFAESLDLAALRTEDGTVLIGISGELEPGKSEESASQAMILSENSRDPASSPLLTVYGGGALSSQPGAGGMWDEDELQSESITLLDGESPRQLVEAFRHLFRAAPNGQARASVVAAALSRHRPELDLEVAQKLEEIAPPFGQAMRHIFTSDIEQGCRALRFLLRSEQDPSAPGWVFFWKNIRSTILHSLTRGERGSLILIRSVDQLADSTSGHELLNHQLLEAFLGRLDTLSPKQQEKLIGMIVEWAVNDPAALDLLKSQLKLTAEKDQRLLLGESLRRAFTALEREGELAELARIFVEEAISAGSTAGSIALTELLRSFGELVFDHTAATENLEQLTERQTLNVVDIWELMVTHSEDLLPRVTEIYLGALETAGEHLSLLLKSELLEREPVYSAFCRWLEESDEGRRRKLVSVGYSWSLTVDNRVRVAEALSGVEWDFEQLWESEWRRPHLSFQRLGWLAQCVEPDKVGFQPAESRVEEILPKPPAHLYFWHLMMLCAGFDSFQDRLRERLLHSAYRTFGATESTQEEEREMLFKVGAAAVRHHQDPRRLMEDWPDRFKEAGPEEVWWLAGVCQELYDGEEEGPEPQRALISAVIHRLLSSGEQSMQDLLARALAADDEETEQVTGFLPLEVSNLCYQAVHAMASHPSCPEALRRTVRRRLALSLISWGNDLKKTTDAYAFRETPLFAILEDLVEETDPQIEELLKEVSGNFLELHRKVPDKFRLEIRHAAQQFFHCWAQAHPETAEGESWSKVLSDLSRPV